jgi:hypothetical protein
MGHMCLCTCYACYHLCEQNFKQVVPLAVLKHQLHAAELKAAGTYTEPNWDGSLQHRGQNAPKKPDEFPQVFDAKVKRVEQAYVHTQPYGSTKALHEGNDVHYRCNCTCRQCRDHCVEVPIKEAVAKRHSEELQVKLQKRFEEALRKEEYEQNHYIDGVTQRTSQSIALGSIWCIRDPTTNK